MFPTAITEGKNPFYMLHYSLYNNLQIRVWAEDINKTDSKKKMLTQNTHYSVYFQLYLESKFARQSESLSFRNLYLYMSWQKSVFIYAFEVKALFSHSLGACSSKVFYISFIFYIFRISLNIPKE